MSVWWSSRARPGWARASSVPTSSRSASRRPGCRSTCIHSPVNAIPAETDVVIAHEGLAERARKAAPNAVVLSFNNFLKNTASEHLLQQLTSGQPVSSDAAGA